MRIISGTARGTKLYTLEGQATRPTLDRVKESLFNIIQNEINIVSEKVTDDCIEEYQEVQEEIATNSQEKKISPN